MTFGRRRSLQHPELALCLQTPTVVRLTYQVSAAWRERQRAPRLLQTGVGQRVPAMTIGREMRVACTLQRVGINAPTLEAR
jgi:hypothetical protein